MLPWVVVVEEQATESAKDSASAKGLRMILCLFLRLVRISVHAQQV
jgi:hypothetical protein